MPNLCHTNEVIGSYVSAGARIHLYRYLDRLEENTIYCHTDCVIYIQPSGEPPLIEMEDKLGYMNSELRTSETISEFVSGGPKNYTYSVLDTGDGREKIVCKIRGLTLNYNASKMVNFDASVA